ncbi:Hypothetical protein NTJ_03362 [Nesidiocoris tenuis]|uniref:Uncharacterized protein n=1 Tax=Nesidiocoris tenuis TaxID=355587 RepID=A0ABN7AH73_9HEMI|nr:Hypothetical protein NTJ_03362 [Nesidiocoris tenuis]
MTGPRASQYESPRELSAEAQVRREKRQRETAGGRGLEGKGNKYWLGKFFKTWNAAITIHVFRPCCSFGKPGATCLIH